MEKGKSCILTKYYYKKKNHISSHDISRGLGFSVKNLGLELLSYSELNLELTSKSEVTIVSGDTLSLSLLVCLDNKGRKESNNCSFYKNLNPEDVVAKIKLTFEGHDDIEVLFCKRVDIKHMIHKSPLKNVFYVELSLKVIDPELTVGLIRKGIGSRKSYGFGFIEIIKK